MFLLQINLLNTISNGIATHVIDNSVIVLISLLGFVVAIYLLYVGGSRWGESVQDFSRMFLPFVDVTTFPIVTLSLAIVHSSSNVGLIVGGILNVVGMSIFSLCYNLFNFSKSPKTINVFQFK